MKKEDQTRDLELESNLLIAEYQVEKLRDRAIDNLGGRFTRSTTKK